MKKLKGERGLRTLKPILVVPFTLKLLTLDIPDEKIIEIGEKTAEDVLVRRIPDELEGETSPKTVLDMMKIYCDVRESVHNGKKVVILAHYAGAKGSLLIGSFYRKLFSLAGEKVEFSGDENAIIFEFLDEPSA